MCEVVVTGYGIVSSLGVTIPEFSRRMFAGDSGVVDIRGTIVARDFPIRVAAPIDWADLPEIPLSGGAPPGKGSQSSRLAALATAEALASLSPGAAVDAIVYATSDGVDFDLIRESFRSFSPESFDWNATRPETCLEWIRRMIELHTGVAVSDDAVISMNNGCSSSNQAIGIAMHRIRSGQWTRALVGGVDARCNAHTLMDFHLLGALSTDEGPRASRPFTLDRNGFVCGEGAGSLLLESRAAAESRGAVALGKVTGYGAASDAYRLTDGRPDIKAVVKAMESAIQDACLRPDQISAVSAHGTSTRLNDALETRALKRVFGQRAYRVPATSLKSQVGHATVAAGALEAIASLLMLREGRLAPTINYDNPDPECDLDYVPNIARAADLSAMLSNNSGFGGQNACVVFERAGAQ